MEYDPYNWYWLVAGSQLFSSKDKSYVQGNNPGFLAWKKAGGIPTIIASESELREVLKQQAPDLCTTDERFSASFDKGDLPRLIFEGFYELTNRLQLLEGKPQITRQQLKEWFKSKL